MKLLIVSGDRSLAAGKHGAFFNTLDGLKDHFDRIDVLTPRIETKGSMEPMPKVFLHVSPTNLWGQPKWIAEEGQRLFAEHKHDVMTVHEFPPFYNGRGAKKLHAATNIPYALEVHHIVGFPEAASFQERVGRFMTDKYIAKDARDAKKVRVVNMEVRTHLVREGVDAKKIECVPSFYLDANILKPDPTAKKEYDIVFTGRLVPNKGVHYLIEAMKNMPRRKLLIIGDGPEKENLQKLAEKLGVSGRISFFGWLPTQEKVFQIIQTAKVFVMNSLSEGGPRVALEAMSLGMPIVATPVGVMPDVIENKVNGLFTTGKPQDLAAKIEMLLSDSALSERLGQNAQAILPQFERSKTIKAYADFLKALV